MERAIFFVSHITSLHKDASSTDLLTDNIIRGIKLNNRKVVLFILCPHIESDQCIFDEYSSIVDQCVSLPCKYTSGLSTVRQYLLSMQGILSPHYFKNVIGSAIRNLKYEPELIISHAPCVESIYFGNALKKHFKDVPFFEFWSDPLTISGITPYDLSLKRYPIKLLEYYYLKLCDRIIYGTKTLMDIQGLVFPRFYKKMSYVDLGYLLDEDCSEEDFFYDNKKVLYAGNFFKEYRNIIPAVNAMGSLDKYSLDIYGNGDVPESYGSNVSFRGRVAPDQLEKIKKRYGIQLCIMNYNCFQIPGKVFYEINSDSKIIIILDGAYSEKIKEYLDTYKRFVFCNNNQDDIRKALIHSESFVFDKKRIESLYSPKKIGNDLLSGGLTILL